VAPSVFPGGALCLWLPVSPLVLHGSEPHCPSWTFLCSGAFVFSSRTLFFLFHSPLIRPPSLPFMVVVVSVPFLVRSSWYRTLSSTARIPPAVRCRCIFMQADKGRRSSSAPLTVRRPSNGSLKVFPLLRGPLHRHFCRSAVVPFLVSLFRRQLSVSFR